MAERMLKKQLQKNNKPYSSAKKPDLFRIIFTFGFFLLLVILPTQLGKHFFFPFSFLSGVRVDYLAPTLYLSDIAVLLLSILSINKIIHALKNKLLLLIFAILIINVIFSLSVPLASYTFIKILEIVCIGILAYYSDLSDQLILFGLSISAIYELFLSILQLITKQSIQGIFYFLGERYMNLSTPGIARASINGIEFLRPYGTFSHPNSLGGFFLIIYVFVLINRRFDKMILLKYSALFLSTLLVLMSFSKAAIASYLIITFLFVLNKFRHCKICTIARLLIVTVIGLLFMRAQGDSLTIVKRIDLMRNSLIIIVQHPIFGVGMGNYLIAQNAFPSRFSFFFNQPVHNIFLLFIAQTGILFGGILAILIFLFFKHRSGMVLLFIFGAIVLTGMFDHYWLTLQQNMLLMGCVIGLALRRTQSV